MMSMSLMGIAGIAGAVIIVVVIGLVTSLEQPIIHQRDRETDNLPMDRVKTVDPQKIKGGYSIWEQE
jgi:hypothetical protein